MAKLTAPLFSTDAHGTLGGVLTYSKRKIVKQVRFQKKQKDFESVARKSQRTRFWVTVQWWKDLSAAEKGEWVTLGRQM